MEGSRMMMMMMMTLLYLLWLLLFALHQVVGTEQVLIYMTG
jgi:hypothetical protein